MSANRLFTIDSRPGRFLALSLALLLVLLIGLFVYFEFENRSNVLDEISSSLNQKLHTKHSIITETFRGNAEAVRFLAGTPPIQGIVRASQNNGLDLQENSTLTTWKDRLSQIFYAYMSSKPHIAQIRYIGKQNDGREIVRVERKHGIGSIQKVPENRLQSKSERSYYRHSAKLSRDGVYISDINLNREYGRLDYPFWPTYRVATPVYDQNEVFFGIIIINYNASLLLSELSADTQTDLRFYLLNSNADYLAHPDADKTFKFETSDKASGWQDEYQLSHKYNNISVYQPLQQGAPKLITADTTVPLTGNNDDLNRQLQLITAAPESLMTSMVNDRRKASSSILLALLLVGGVIILIYRRMMLSRVNLSAAESEYETLITGTKDAIVSLDKQGLVKKWNPATIDILRLRDHDLSGETLDELIKSDQETSVITKAVDDCLAQNKFVAFDIKTSKPDGSKLALSISVSPIHNGSEMLGASVIIRDVTQQLRDKEQLELLNTSLEEKVLQRTRELRQAKDAAESASLVKSSFVANVSHEIRTPLNGIIGMHNLLRREPLSTKQKNYLDMATQSAKSLSMLINDLLDLSKIEAGKLEFDNRSMNLIDNFSQAANSMAVRAMDKNVEVVLDVAEINHPMVIGDSLRLRQILNNLISNAIKFTDHGHILIKASTGLSDDQQQVILSTEITDTGIGIDKDKLQNLFKAFSQEDVSTTRRYGGTGLGLSIVSNLCLLMDGACHVESEKNKGSTFHFSLKLQRDQEHELRLSQMIDLSGLSVLVSQQSDEVKKALCKLLKQWQANVILDVDADDEADIVISDSNAAIALSDTENATINAHEGFILTLSLKQRQQQDMVLAQKQLEVIYRPIQPAQLAAALASLSGRALSLPDKQADADSSGQAQAQLLRSLNHHPLLIVDDNEINQKVAAGILEHYGFAIKTASDGQEALRILSENHDISLVLMDCQMPVMDGFTATARVRQGEAGQDKSKIPVIAMTASAMTGDREDCLNAGMNDYLTKPISPQDLEDKVSFWLMARDSGLESNLSPPPSHTSHPKLSSERQVFDSEATLKRLLNDEVLFNNMLDMFVESAPSQIEEIRTAILTEQMETVRQQAHKMRGGAAAIGAELMAEVACELEKAAQNADHESLHQLGDEINKAWADLSVEISEFKALKMTNEN